MPFDSTTLEDELRLFRGAHSFELDPQSSGASAVTVQGINTGQTGGQILYSDSPRVLLDRLAEDDPLDIQARTRKRILFQSLLMDWERVTRRSMAYVAFIAARDRYRGKPDLAEYIDMGIDEAIHSLIEEDWNSDRRQEPIDAESDPYADVTLGAKLDPSHARRVTLEFNLQPISMRRPLHDVLVKNRSIAAAAKSSGIPMGEIRCHVRVMLGRMAYAEQTKAQLDALLANLEASAV